MNHIRKAKMRDISRLAEIEIFNYRLYFYPIFKNDEYYFNELQVVPIAEELRGNAEAIANTYVYDDGVVKGFIRIARGEVQKLFVEPALQGASIGSTLLEYAVREHGVTYLWALEKNTRAIRFYKRHGFQVTGEKKLEDGTTEYLVRLKR